MCICVDRQRDLRSHQDSDLLARVVSVSRITTHTHRPMKAFFHLISPSPSFSLWSSSSSSVSGNTSVRRFRSSSASVPLLSSAVSSLSSSSSFVHVVRSFVLQLSACPLFGLTAWHSRLFSSSGLLHLSCFCFFSCCCCGNFRHSISVSSASAVPYPSEDSNVCVEFMKVDLWFLKYYRRKKFCVESMKMHTSLILTYCTKNKSLGNLWK